jgi:hypothetical protein
MTCETMRDRIGRDLDGDLPAADRAALHDHLRDCAGCGAARDQEAALRRILEQGRMPDPSAELLAGARAALVEAIAREPRAAVGEPRAAAEAGAWAIPARPAWYGWLVGTGRRAPFRLSPAAAVVLVLVGAAIGLFAPRPGAGGRWPWSGRPAGPAPMSDAGEAEGETVAVRDLAAGPRTGTLRVDYDTLQRGALTGSPADPRIRRLLVDTLRDNPNDGLRLEAIEALGGQVADAEAREALLWAAVQDRNAGARLSAIEALAARAAGDGAVRRALLEALQRDANPGVRVRAIDALAAAPHPDDLPVLRRLARADRNDYVRIQAAALVGAAAGGGR